VTRERRVSMRRVDDTASDRKKPYKLNATAEATGFH
jgi:hypothetical protein